jgi:hypothetical protein
MFSVIDGPIKITPTLAPRMESWRGSVSDKRPQSLTLIRSGSNDYADCPMRCAEHCVKSIGERSQLIKIRKLISKPRRTAALSML